MPKFRMPAEWEKHEATWLAWPHFRSHWPGKFEPIPYVYAEIIRALIPSEKVYVCVKDAAMEQSARQILQAKKVNFNPEQVRFFHIPTDASWSRDHGPIFVLDENNKLVITDWGFNACGGPWPYAQDDVVPTKVGTALKIPVVEPGIILEGGSIDVNGLGTLLTTKSCLLNKNRNPHLNQEQIAAKLKEYLGAENILWLEEGIVGDDTSGHVDDIARFVNENTVVCAVETKKSASNYASLKQNFALLEKMTDQDGKLLNVVPLPSPSPVMHEGMQLPASYANFYIGNTVVLLPTFRCPQDAEAQQILQNLFPTRKVVGIDCTDLIWGFGAIHCSTQQQPAA